MIGSLQERQKDSNALRLVLRSRPSDLDLPLRLWALRLEITYRVLPVRWDT